MTPRVPGRERPILFSGEMVRAILDGRKTQTRRVVGAKASWDRPAGYRHAEIRMRPDFDAEIYWPEFPDFPPIRVRNRYGKPGDRLWVRETFFDHDSNYGDPTTKLSPERLAGRIEYRADEWDRKGDGDAGGWSPSIHMPRWASRLTLEITEVRVERVQDIGEVDAIFEGVEPVENAEPRDPDGWDATDYRAGFARLWDSLNKSRGYGWDANPFVWCIAFKRLESGLPSEERERTP